MKRYAITEGLGPERALVYVAHNLERGVEMIQIREKQLTGRELAELVRQVMALPNSYGTRILVNSRLDIAIACGAHGVHLPADSFAAGREMRAGDLRYAVAASCHTAEEVERAEREDADLVVFGPVFPTGGKTPVGLDALRHAAGIVSIPVYALGGITQDNAAECIAAGAAGIAGIRLFRP